MWPFKRKRSTPATVPPGAISYSQVDVTERFGDNLSLGPDEWIATTAMNGMVPNPQSQGLPAVGAAVEEVYRVADRLSRIRESVPVPDDGVYCPICHTANVTLSLLRTPCPKCGRPLLKFGWS